MDQKPKQTTAVDDVEAWCAWQIDNSPPFGVVNLPPFGVVAAREVLAWVKHLKPGPVEQGRSDEH